MTRDAVIHRSAIGEAITLDALSDDPYPIYARLRRDAPVAWAPALDMWLVTRYEDVRSVLLDDVSFVVGTPRSLLFATFGEQMLTSEAETHRRYRDSGTQIAFMPRNIASRLVDRIGARVARLLDPIITKGEADLRQAVATRLPVQVMLDLFGLPDADEALLRDWYDAFEAALANHEHHAAVKTRAAVASTAFHDHLQAHLEQLRHCPNDGLLSAWLAVPSERRLSDAEIRRNALIVMFGGISTVEALILNTLWALVQHPQELTVICRERAKLPAAVDETMRWIAPVQSATRHATCDALIAGVAIPAGAVVNCMIASANRDDTVFADPDIFWPRRANAARHLGFATGPHHCLGQHLAKLEATVAIGALLDRTTDLRLAASAALRGHEFRQPRTLPLTWRIV